MRIFVRSDVNFNFNFNSFICRTSSKRRSQIEKRRLSNASTRFRIRCFSQSSKLFACLSLRWSSIERLVSRLNLFKTDFLWWWRWWWKWIFFCLFRSNNQMSMKSIRDERQKNRTNQFFSFLFLLLHFSIMMLLKMRETREEKNPNERREKWSVVSDFHQQMMLTTRTPLDRYSAAKISINKEQVHAAIVTIEQWSHSQVRNERFSRSNSIRNSLAMSINRTTDSIVQFDSIGYALDSSSTFVTSRLFLRCQISISKLSFQTNQYAG